MKVGIRAICHPPIAAGFGLAGIAALAASTPGDAAAAMTSILEDPSIGVVLIEEQFNRDMPDELRRRLAHSATPVVVPFRTDAWLARSDHVDSYIVELLRRVIGYRVRLR